MNKKLEDKTVWLVDKFWAAQDGISAGLSWVGGYLKNIAYLTSAAFNVVLAGGDYRMTLSAKMGWEKRKRKIKEFPLTWHWPGLLYWAADQVVEVTDEDHSDEAFVNEVLKLRARIAELEKV